MKLQKNTLLALSSMLEIAGQPQRRERLADHIRDVARVFGQRQLRIRARAADAVDRGGRVAGAVEVAGPGGR